MKAKKYWILAGLMAGICATVCLAAATFERDSLVGLRGIYVVAETSPEAEEYGLSKEVLQADTKKQLRQSGIKVISEEEWKQTPGLPLLSVSVTVKTHSELKNVAAVGTDVSFVQSVLLAREQSKVCHGAVTWRTGGTYLGGIEHIKDSKELVKEHVDEFINDYLAANPKEEKKPVKDKDVIKGTGTIRWAEVEGGFYVIDTDNGVNYDPINLPKEYAIDGLNVKFEVVERPDIVSIHMNGPIVEIIKIEKIEKSRRK